MPWAKGQSGNPGGRPSEMEPNVRKVRALAKARSWKAFRIVWELARHADKDSVRLAAALAVLKIAGVLTGGDTAVTVQTHPLNPCQTRPTPELLQLAATSVTDRTH